MREMMFGNRLHSSTLALRALTLLGAVALINPVHAELQPEPIPNVESLVVPYPDSYAVVHDFSDSKFGLFDTKSQLLKGMLSAGQFATIDISMQRQKFYVGETVYSRGTRGTRQDIVAIYDFENLSLVGEVFLPPKRMNVVVNAGSTAITPDEKFMLVFNMNPATSVTVIDLDNETVVGEIQTPGCSLVYPYSKGGFFTLCGNGGLVAISLDGQGRESGRWASESFNDIGKDPLSEKAEMIDGVWHFVSYAGEVQPIDVTGARPVLGTRWWLTNEAERAANWRPAGWHGKAGHSDGLLWVAMAPDGYDGSHKDPAHEVWLFNTTTGERLARLPLKVNGLSITASAGEDPQLLVLNIEGNLDVYDGKSGEYLRSIHALGDTPMMVHALY
jgi:methylamine dehydrogenase heavy chain